MMENDALRLVKDGKPFWVAGVADQIPFLIQGLEDHGLDDLPGTLAKVTDAAPVLLMIHEPALFLDVPQRVSLTLAGHTHGGRCVCSATHRPSGPSMAATSRMDTLCGAAST